MNREVRRLADYMVMQGFRAVRLGSLDENRWPSIDETARLVHESRSALVIQQRAGELWVIATNVRRKHVEKSGEGLPVERGRFNRYRSAA